MQFEHGAQGAEDAGSTAHVEFHFIHAGAGLEADAAGVESDAFAHQHERLLAFLAALVVEHDQAWRLVAALANGVEGAHAQVLDLLLVQHLDLEALEFLAQGLGLFGQVARVANVRWQVAQVAGEAHAVGDGDSVLDRALNVTGAGLGAEQGDLLQGARFGLLALELVENVLAIEQGFGKQAGLAIEGIAAGDGDVVQGQCRIAAVQAFEHCQHAGNDLAPAAITQFGILAGTDQQYALGLEVGQAVQQQGLADLAGQIAALEHAGQGTAGGFVDGFGNGAEFAAFCHGQYQGGGFQGCCGYAFYNQFHVRFPE
ncbi:hypothetical protein D3C78_462230 [compost metagenome]